MEYEIKSLGQWQGYVVAGKTFGEVRERLAEVPDELRPQVQSHVDTVLARKLKAKSSGKKSKTGK